MNINFDEGTYEEARMAAINTLRNKVATEIEKHVNDNEQNSLGDRIYQRSLTQSPHLPSVDADVKQYEKHSRWKKIQEILDVLNSQCPEIRTEDDLDAVDLMTMKQACKNLTELLIHWAYRNRAQQTRSENGSKSQRML